MNPAVDQALQVAVQNHQAGRVDQAEAQYRQILAEHPQHPQAMHLLGALLGQQNRPGEAISLIRHSIALQPNNPQALSNLGKILTDDGQIEEAIASCRRAIELQPNYATAHNNLGNALRSRGAMDHAIDCFKRAIALRPDYTEAYNNLGNALKAKGELELAIEAYQRALSFRAGFVPALSNLAQTLGEHGRLDEAMIIYQQLLAMRSDDLEARAAMAAVLVRKSIEVTDAGRWADGIVFAERALSLDRQLAAAHNALGNALYLADRLDEAAASYRTAAEFDPKFGQAQCNLANVLKDQGSIEAAVDVLNNALADGCDDPRVWSNYLLALHYHPGYTAQQILEQHVRWAKAQAEPLKNEWLAHEHDRSPDRRLRIGYVSPDFSDHTLGRAILDIFKHHVHEQFEILCFSDVTRDDEVTGQLRHHADAWHDTSILSDEALTDLVREKQIDILVDLTLHTAANRLLMFARKPAPVQVTFLAYAGTSGMEAMDYRITDEYIDPPSAPEPYTEKSVRLAGCYWSYPQPADAPPVSELPAAGGRGVTFGCLNNFCKVSDAALSAWAQILAATLNSRLILFSPPGAGRERVRDKFAAAGIDPQRIEFVAKLPRDEYFAAYRRIDIALDPFPFTGGVTSCDALWMGVPIVTLRGETAVGRGGTSLLNNLGLGELIAQTTSQYVDLAHKLASDLPRLKDLRRTLRERMRNSPICDSQSHTANLEQAFREMWRAWCESGDGTESAEAYFRLGGLYLSQGRPDAVKAYHRSIALRPDFAEAHADLGNSLRDHGRIREAVDALRAAARVAPDDTRMWSNLLLTVHYDDRADGQQILQEHQRWDATLAAPLKQFWRPHENERSPQRRLRIGYVSADFRQHVLGRSLRSFFAMHDHDQFDIACFSGVRKEDQLTRQFKQWSDQSHDVADLSDAALAELIREKRIDILVDLAVHTAYNRLLAFARKPAPVQVSYAGYPATSGLSAMDYRLTDPHLDPAGQTEQFNSEQLVRLGSFWCYCTDESAPQVKNLPALSRGYVTFGSLNNLCKISPTSIELWSEVLRAVPQSRLMLVGIEQLPSRYFLEQFGARGISADRIVMVPRRPPTEYLGLYDEIDIGLDPLPYNGHMTSCDSLWMGVPMVTLAGKTSVGRGGVSLLSNLELPQFIANSPEQYVQIAREVAADLPKLTAIRRGLRERMRASRICDATAATREIENAYRVMWRKWCESPR